jgi:tetratricopeptide (TPR) repeat protein
MDIESARSILEQGDLAGAEAAYRELLEDPAQQCGAMYGLGFIYYKKQDLRPAEYWFNEQLKVDPRSQNSLYFLGEIAASRHNHDAAVVLFAKVLTLNPRHVGALRRLTQVAGAMRATSSTEATSQPLGFGDRGNPVQPVAALSPETRRASIPQSGIPVAPTVPPRPEYRPPVAPTAPPRPAARPPRPPFSSRSIIGVAQQVRLLAVPFNGHAAAQQSLAFRVAVMDRNGHPRGTIAVEMRSFRIQGNVENGDWVEIGKVGRSGKVTSFRNLSTGGQIRTRLW